MVLRQLQPLVHPVHGNFFAVLSPVLLVLHLSLHKAGDPTFTSLTVLLAVMSLSWPIQFLRIRGSRRWEQAHNPDPDTR